MLYLNRKALLVHQEFGAYIAIVDRYGNVMDNMQTAYADDPDFASSVDMDKVRDSLNQVLSGEEISVRTESGSGAMFTVGVPFVQDEQTLGAVFIQTDAQELEGGLDELLRQVIPATLIAMLLAALCTFLYMRSAMRPLGQVTAAARAMSAGTFGQRADEKHGAPEIRELSAAFNNMSAQLEKTEMSRREFVSNVSHELRSPMTSISGFVQGMLDGTIPPEEHERYLGIVYDETRRLTKLTGDLLKLSRLERDDAVLNRTDFDLCELLCRVLICKEAALDEKHIEVECDFEEDSLPVHADRDSIEQVARNLLDNAIRFTPEKGIIVLRCRRVKGKCLTTVADNGPGVPKEDRGRVFERFFTADRAHTSGNGTGLGLSICQRILQMHGETITLDDTDAGASFTFTLPCAESR